MFRVGIFALIDAWRVPRNWQSALHVVRQAESWPREGVGSTRLGHVLAQCGFAYYTFGEVDEARRLFSNLEALSERTRDFSLILMSTVVSSLMEFHDGKLQAAIQGALDIAGREAQSGMRLPGGGFLAISRGAVYLGDDDLISSIGRGVVRDASLERGVGADLATALAMASRGARSESQAILRRFADARNPEDAPCDLLALGLEAALMIEDREFAAKFSRPLEPMMAGLAPASVARLLGRTAELSAEVTTRTSATPPSSTWTSRSASSGR
jgi:hypothetical protein